ncbi:MAG: hypothetical protein QOF53_137 [Nocardioidaceae bacterium]|nr:hypothetical protein [Nocardioidaceae bacterium]
MGPSLRVAADRRRTARSRAAYRGSCRARCPADCPTCCPDHLPAYHLPAYRLPAYRLPAYCLPSFWRRFPLSTSSWATSRSLMLPFEEARTRNAKARSSFIS